MIKGILCISGILLKYISVSTKCQYILFIHTAKFTETEKTGRINIILGA